MAYSILPKLYPDRELVWFPRRGYGYCRSGGFAYGREYHEEYVRRGATEVGGLINESRVKTVNRHFRGEALDIGAGAGHFVRARNASAPTFGFDINPSSVRELRAEGLYCHPGEHDFACLTFWDSIEHIPDPSPLFRNGVQWVMLSTPLYESCEAVLESKHYKPDEHVWYFTFAGIVNFMGAFGFEAVHADNSEARLGRDHIGTFVFRRDHNGHD